VVEELDKRIAEIDAPTVVIQQKDIPPPPPQKPAWMVPAIVAGVLAVGAGGYFATRKPEVPPAPSGPTGPVLAKSISTPTGEMLLVPAGNFLFGEANEQVNLPAFYIDRTEVSNGAYLEFCNATKRPLPADFPKDKPDLPVVKVSILDAQNFAAWAEKRLPTARQWEKAARGAAGFRYTWGNDPDSKRANVAADKDHPGDIRPVGEHANGASPFGALQMIGNVWELVDQLSTPRENALAYFATQLKPKPGAEEPCYTIRVQSFSDVLDPKVLSDATTVPARWKDFNIGFRCVKDAQ
jgi:formylglycine-generating enzyme required for sulfatase activity